MTKHLKNSKCYNDHVSANRMSEKQIRNAARRSVLKLELLENRIALSANSLLSIPTNLPESSHAVDSTENNIVRDIATDVRSAKINADDLGDSYWHQGEQISLLQLHDEVVVGLVEKEEDSAGVFSPASQNVYQVNWADTVSLGQGRRILTKNLNVNSFPALSREAADASLAYQLDEREDLLWYAPVFFSPEYDSRAVITNEVVVALNDAADANDVFDTRFSSYKRISGTSNQFVAILKNGAGALVLRLANELTMDSRVKWASPKIYSEIKSAASPNDPLFNQQVNLHNTGQIGAADGADAHLLEAWDDTTGIGSDVVVAVLDTGVQTDHPDLNIWVNPGETPNSGIDDDGNGWIDDLNGWDFFDNDNNPNPNVSNSGGTDNHGTSVAGVAAAIGNNNLGVTGASWGAQVMPVKVFRNETFTSYTDAAPAIYYAAGRTKDATGTWDAADILNLSFGGGVPEQGFSDALAWASANGRGGLGTSVFVATGNSASSFVNYSHNLDRAHNYAAQWRYSGGASGGDTKWLGQFVFPGDGSVERFATNQLPFGWSSGGDLTWTIVDDPGHNYGVSQFVAKAGNVTGSGVSILTSPTFTVDPFLGGSELSFQAWTNNSASSDDLSLYISKDGGPFELALALNTYDPNFGLTTAVAYPANLTSTIAVGASTDWDFRSDYSQYGLELDFVAPSNGGFSNVTTTDRTGLVGYGAGDYTSRFSGTSAATPLAAGIAALMLAKAPELTASEIREVMRASADKIGGVEYTNGFNNFYGYGRVNADSALRLIQTSDALVSELDPVADTFARGGAYSIDNYGSVNGLSVKKVGSPDFTREAFLKFDISGLDSAAYATLSLSVLSHDLGINPLDHELYIIDPVWGSNTESGLTWSNSRSPALQGTLAATWTLSSTLIASGSPIEINLTEAVRAALAAGQNTIAFRIASSGATDRGVIYQSRESAIGKPTLTIYPTPRKQSLSSVADTYVRGGVYSTDNYGSVDGLSVKKVGSPDFTREAFLEFDISGLDSASYATLSLSVLSHDLGINPLDHELYIIDPVWGSNTESGLTWSNSRSPALQGTLAATWTLSSSLIANGSPIEINLTDAVQAAIAAGQDSIAIRIASSGTTDRGVAYQSRESTTGKPTLNIYPIPQTQILSPEADTFVRGGVVYSNDNYGSFNYLSVKKVGSEDYTREAFLKYDISGVGSASYATLSLSVFSHDLGINPLEHKLYVVDPNWGSSNESSLTWGNSRSPAMHGILAATWTVSSASIASGSQIEINLSDAVQTAIAAGQDSIAFRIVSSGATDRSVNYRSRESTNGRPMLNIYS
ncbi:CBM96 family carbohydrate-binding protein [Rubripirellula tenax]|nr:DNRLRE domain-containing protein [Rubripirellula tenax]